MLKQIIIARYHGFCMGVKRAITIAEETASTENQPVAILNEIVHNEAVVNKFKDKGVGQVKSVEEFTTGTLIISAHGVSPDVKEKAIAQGAKVVDATCPLVENIYEIILRVVGEGFHVIHYGEAHHDETQGVYGHAPDNITVVSSEEELNALPDWSDRKLGLTVQTTAHMELFAGVQEAAKKKWPQIEIFDTICNATSKRQEAVLELAPKVDFFLVVGSRSSANSNRLAQIADGLCGQGVLIDTAADIKEEWFNADSKIEKVGLSAGASTPEFLVEEVVKRLVEISGGLAEVVLPDRRRSRINRV